jgi:cytochrome P450
MFRRSGMSADGHSQLPPGPDLTAEQARDIETDPITAFNRYHAAFGADFTISHSGVPKRVFLGSPEAIREVLVGNGHNLDSTGSTAFQAIVGKHAIIFLNGEDHLRARKLLGWPLMGSRMRQLGQLIADQTKVALDEAKTTGTVPLIELTRRVTMGVLVRLLFGNISVARVERVTALADELLSTLNSKNADNIRVENLCHLLDDFIAQEVAGRAESPDPDSIDLVSHLLRQRNLGDANLSDQQIRGHVISLLVAGFETTAATLAWGALLVATHADVRGTLAGALRALGEGVEPNVMANEPYLVAVCQEVLRLSSVVPTGLTRRARENIHTSEQVITRDTEVVPCIHVAHRRPARYPEPNKFDPSRFLGQRHSQTDYLPFGVGTRRCLGAAFSSYELAIALAVIFRTPGFRIHMPPEPVHGVAHGPTIAFPMAVLATVADDDT